MLRYNFLFFLIIAPFALFAQMPGRPRNATPSIKGTIKGTLVDSITQAPLEYASVVLTLPGGKMLDGQITDEKGQFRFRDVNTSTYELQATFIGYDPKITRGVTTTPAKPDLDLGKIVLVSQGVNLDEIVVTEESPVMESKIDKLVYNADKDITNLGGDGADVLRKVPLLSVDLDGNVSLRGNNNVRIFINGKPSSMFAGNVADALKSLPGDQIKSVEVITTPTARYDGEGSTGIINIILKRPEMQGLTGSVNASLGTRSNNADVNIASARGRFGLNASAGTRFTWYRPGTQSFYRKDDLANDFTRVLEQSGNARSAWRGFNGSIGAFYDFNAYSSLNSNIRINGNQFVKDGRTNSLFDDPSLGLYQEYSRFNDDVNLGAGIDWTTDYRHTFAGNKEKEWSVSYQLSTRFSDESTMIDQTGDPLLLIHQNNDNLGLNLEHILQTDYIHPFTPAIKLETGLKATLRRMESDFNYANFDEGTDEFVRDPNTSGSFNYRQDVGAAYASLNVKLSDKYDLIAGARYEYTAIEGEAVNGEQPFTNNYGSLLPSAIIARKFGPFTSLKISYSQRIQRPGLRYINPYQQLSDPRNITIGNPGLLPELTNQVELNYGTFVKGSVVNVSVYYRNTEDIIENFLIINTNGASINTYRNIGQNDAIGANFFGTTSFFKKKFTVRGSFDIFSYQSAATINGEELSNQDINWNSFMTLSYDFGKGYKAEMFGMFRSQQTTLQGRIPSFWIYSFAFQKEIAKKLSIGLTIVEPFNLNKSFATNLTGPTFRQESNFSVPFQSFGVNVRYAFGKLESRTSSRKSKVKSDDLKGGEDNNF